MGLTGKYDFKGIQKWGARGLLAALSSIPNVGLLLTKLPVLRTIIEFGSEFISNWLANNGLILINTGAFIIGGKLDQNKFDKAIEDGIAKMKVPGVTPAQQKAIDDEVINAFRKFGRVTRHN